MTLFIQNFGSQGEGDLSLSRGFIHVYDCYFKSSFSLKPHGKSKPNCKWNVNGSGGETSFRILNGLGCMCTSHFCTQWGVHPLTWDYIHV